MAEGLLNTARSLRPAILEARFAMETARSLPTTLVEALISKQLLRIAVSVEEGGLEAAPVDILQTLEELASVDASPAWIVWNNTLPALLSRYLGANTRRELLGDRSLVTANSTRPSGAAMPERNGLRISGRWSLVSGCGLADLFLLHCAVGTPAETAHETILAFLPKADCKIIDTWHSGGLCGTGSHDVVVDNTFVDATRIVAFTAPLQLHTPLYAMPFAALMSAGCAAMCLGVARAALDGLICLAGDKEPADPGLRLRERPSLQKLLPQLDAAHMAARLLLYDTVESAWQTCCAKAPVGAEQKARLWGAALHAGRTSRDVVRQAYDAAGTPALYTSSPLERAHRDIHAMGRHIVLDERWDEDAGRVILGQTASNPMF